MYSGIGEEEAKSDVRTSLAKYKYASQGNLIIVRELSGKFALLKLWTPCIYPCLVLVQPRKTCPGITEKLLTGT